METSNNNNSNGNHLLLDNTNKNTSTASSSTPIEAKMNNNNNNFNDDHRQTPTLTLQKQQQGASSTHEEKSLQHSSYNQQAFSSSSLVHQTQNHPNNDDDNNENNNSKKKELITKNNNSNNNNNNLEENTKDFLSEDDEEDANNNDNNKSDSSSVPKKDDKNINDDDEDTNTNHQSDQQSSLQHSSNNQQASLPPPEKNQKKKIVNKKKQKQSSGANNNNQTELRHSDQQSSLRSLQHLMKLISEDKIEEMNKFLQDNHNTDETKKLFQQMVTIGLKKATLFHHATLRASREVFSTILQFIEKSGKEFAKQQLDSLTENTETGFHCAVTSCNDAVEKYEALFNFAKEILDEDELKKLLLKVDNYGHTAFTCIVSYDGISFDEMSKLVIETHAKFGHNLLEEVAAQIDGWGKTPIMWAAEFKSGKDLKLFMNNIKQHGGGELELLKKVLDTPLKECSAGFVIVSAFLNHAEPRQAVAAIFDAFKEIGGIEYLREMVLSKSLEGTSIFMTICRLARSDEHLKVFVDVVQQYINDNAFFLSMLKAQDACDSVALHYLTDNNELKENKNQALARYFCGLLVEAGLFSDQFTKLNVDEQKKIKSVGIDSSFALIYLLPLAPKQQGHSSQTARKMNSTNRHLHQKALVAPAPAAKNINDIDEHNTMDNNSSSSPENNNNNDDETTNGDNTVEELRKLEAAKEALVEEHEAMKKELAEIKAKNKNMISNLEQQVDTQNAEFKNVIEQLASIKKLNEKMISTTKKELYEKSEQLEAEKNKNKNRIKNFEQQADKQKDVVEKAKKELSSFKKQAEENHKTLKAVILARDNTIAQKDELLFQQKQRFSALQRKLDKMESNDNTNDDNNNDNYDVVDEDETVVLQLKQEVNDFKINQKKLQEKLKEAETAKKKSDEEIASLQQQNDALKQQASSEKIKFNEELEGARQNTAFALAALNDLHEQHNNENQQFEMEKTERKNLEQMLKGAEAAFNQHKKNSDETLASLQKQLEAANKSRNTSNKSNNNNNNNNSSNSDDNVAAAKMEAVEKERDELQKLVKEFQEKEEGRQKQLKNEQLKAAALQELLGESDELVRALRLEIRVMMKMNSGGEH